MAAKKRGGEKRKRTRAKLKRKNAKGILRPGKKAHRAQARRTPKAGRKANAASRAGKKRHKGKPYALHTLKSRATFMIFIAILIITWILINNLQPADEKQVEQRLGSIIDEDNTLSKEKLIELKEMDYYRLKRELGVAKDFYIHLEDEDGNIIPIDDDTYCIGSPRGQVNGVNCK